MKQPQSIIFLRELAAFRGSSFGVEIDEDTQFREFIRLVNKFVKSGSSYEVNIDSRARNKVMRYSDEARFKELDAVSNGFRPFPCSNKVEGQRKGEVFRRLSREVGLLPPRARSLTVHMRTLDKWSLATDRV